MGASPFMTVLQVVNEVCGRMNVRAVSSTSQNSFTINLVSLLNDIVDDLLDFGEWNELRASATFTLVSGQARYAAATTALATANWFVHSISEVRVSGRVPPLEPIADVNEGRMLLRTGSQGQSSRFFVEGQDGLGNPKVNLFPVPNAQYDGVMGYIKFQVQPPRYEAGTDDSAVIPFPGRVLVAGLLAAAILDESGGSETQQYKSQMQKYLILRNNALGRQTAKTGEYVQFQVGRITRS